MPIVTNTSAGLQGQQLALVADMPIRISVKQFPFLAYGNGINNDTTAIRNAIDALPATGGIVYFPPGVYIIHSDPGLVNEDIGAILKLTKQNTRLTGEGSSSVIKVAGGSYPYTSIIGGAVFSTTVLSGLEIDHLVFDHNIAANNLAFYDTVNFQASIEAGVGFNFKIHHCEFKNSSSVNNIVVHGKYHQITDNYFHDNGDDPLRTFHPASVIYVYGEYVSIKNNIIISAARNAGGADTGIETHGSYMDIDGNVIRDYLTGIKISSVFEPITNCFGINISGNTISGGCRGVEIESAGYPLVGKTVDIVAGFNGVLIDGNIIELAGNQAWPTRNQDKYRCGIAFIPGGENGLDSNDITISNNIISHPLESSAILTNTNSSGIGWVNTSWRVLSNAKITGNRILNFPVAGVRLWCDLTCVDISNNDFINCGSTLDTAVPGDNAVRIPLMVYPKNCHGLSINNNRFYDDLVEITWRPLYFIILFQDQLLTASHVTLLDNTFESRGSTMYSQVYVQPAGNPFMQPYLRGAIRNFKVISLGQPLQKFALGSQVVDPADGKIYTINHNQYSWSPVPLSISDFVGNGWGSGSVVQSATGSSVAFLVSILCNGTGQTANPTLTFDYKSGPFLTNPIPVGCLAYTDDFPMKGCLFYSSPSQCVITLIGTPVAGKFYQFNVVVIPRTVA